MLPDGYVEPSGFLGVTTASPFGLRVISILPGFSVSGVAGVALAGVVTSTGCDGFLLGSVTVPVPGTSFLGSLSFGTSPEPLSPIVTSIGVLFSPGITTLLPDGYVEPSGFLGVTIAFPFGLRVISILPGFSVS